MPLEACTRHPCAMHRSRWLSHSAGRWVPGSTRGYSYSVMILSVDVDFGAPGMPRRVVNHLRGVWVGSVTTCPDPDTVTG